LDWKDRDAEIVAERMAEAAAGMIILAHDIHESTVDAMPAVVESLARRGIRFVTVTELVGPPGPVAGRVYVRGPAPR
jgi:peptidoglycan/xylan/chitin deacetylase (PgdA/CDA1 family)